MSLPASRGPSRTCLKNGPFIAAPRRCFEVLDTPGMKAPPGAVREHNSEHILRKKTRNSFILRQL